MSVVAVSIKKKTEGVMTVSLIVCVRMAWVWGLAMFGRDFLLPPVDENIALCLPAHAMFALVFFFSSRRRHTSCYRDWSSDVCSSDLPVAKTMASTAISSEVVRTPVG